MNTPAFRLNPRVLAAIVWRDLLGALDLERDAVARRLAELWSACEATRPKMAYDTGSISAASGLALYALARRFAPKAAFEVGTFIGRSTVSLALGSDDSGADATIYTCDASNDFHLAYPGRARIVGFPRKSSTLALAEVAAANAAIDLFHFDGRIAIEDLPLIQKLARPSAIHAIDDFEGTEKGVANVSLLRAQPWMGGHVLVYPPQPALLAECGVLSVSTTALLVPAAHFGFASQ